MPEKPHLDLPSKLSELLRLAVGDLRNAIAAGHGVCMYSWVASAARMAKDTLAGLALPGSKCYVCLAGAVMLRGLPESFERRSCVDPEDFDEDTASKLRAINRLREGDVNKAAQACPLLLTEAERQRAYDWRVPVPAFDRENPEHFLRAMDGLADKLAARGL